MGFGSFFLGGGASTTCLFSQTHFLHRVFLFRPNFSCFYITTMMMKTMVTNTLMIMKMMVISMIETTMVMVMIMMMELVGRCSKAWYKPACGWSTKTRKPLLKNYHCHSYDKNITIVIVVTKNITIVKVMTNIQEMIIILWQYLVLFIWLTFIASSSGWCTQTWQWQKKTCKGLDNYD